MKKFNFHSIVITCVFLLSFQSNAIAVHNGGSGGPTDSKEQGSSHGQPFKTLQSHIDLLETDFDAAIADLQRQIDDLVASQAAQDVLISTLQTAVNLLDSRVTTNEGDIAALQAKDDFLAQLIAALDVRLTSLEGRVSTNEGDITAIILADQTTQTLILAIQGQITTLNGLITANAGDISTLQGNISTLNITLTSLQNQLILKQDRVNGVCPIDSSIRVINADGTVVCEPDTVSAGVGTFQQLTVSTIQEIPSAGILVGTLNLSATCPSTHRVTGGGYEITTFGILIAGDPRFVKVTRSIPNSSTTWNVFVLNDNVVILGNGRANLRVFASCGRVQ